MLSTAKLFGASRLSLYVVSWTFPRARLYMNIFSMLPLAPYTARVRTPMKLKSITLLPRPLRPFHGLGEMACLSQQVPIHRLLHISLSTSCVVKGKYLSWCNLQCIGATSRALGERFFEVLEPQPQWSKLKMDFELSKATGGD